MTRRAGPHAPVRRAHGRHPGAWPSSLPLSSTLFVCFPLTLLGCFPLVLFRHGAHTGLSAADCLEHLLTAVSVAGGVGLGWGGGGRGGGLCVRLGGYCVFERECVCVCERVRVCV